MMEIVGSTAPINIMISHDPSLKQTLIDTIVLSTIKLLLSNME